MKALRIFGDLFASVLIGSLFGGGVLLLTARLKLPILEPGQRPIFFIGIILFSVAFRLLLSLRDHSEG